MIFPEFPKKSNIIGICAPSAGVGGKIGSFELSLETIKSLGFGIKETASVRVDDVRPASGKVRAEEYHSLLTDPEVCSIIAATGGEYNYEVLPHLDPDIIREHPKWFCGYSDPTCIEYYLTTGLDIATIYGFNAGAFDWRPLHEFQTNALSILKGDIIRQHSFELWDSARDWEKVSLDTPVSWDLYLNSEIFRDKYTAKGRLIGGCTDVIAKIIGTSFDHTSEFIDKYEEDGFIWYFDTFEMSAENLYLTMLQMKYAGCFRNAQAIIFGRVMLPGNSTDENYIDNLKRAFDDIPFVWGADIGHTKPAMVLINGAMAEITLHDGKSELCIELK